MVHGFPPQRESWVGAGPATGSTPLLFTTSVVDYWHQRHGDRVASLRDRIAHGTGPAFGEVATHGRVPPLALRPPSGRAPPQELRPPQGQGPASGAPGLWSYGWFYLHTHMVLHPGVDISVFFLRLWSCFLLDYPDLGVAVSAFSYCVSFIYYHICHS